MCIKPTLNSLFNFFVNAMKSDGLITNRHLLSAVGENYSVALLAKKTNKKTTQNKKITLEPRHHYLNNLFDNNNL